MPTSVNNTELKSDMKYHLLLFHLHMWRLHVICTRSVNDSVDVYSVPSSIGYYQYQ